LGLYLHLEVFFFTFILKKKTRIMSSLEKLTGKTPWFQV